MTSPIPMSAGEQALVEELAAPSVALICSLDSSWIGNGSEPNLQDRDEVRWPPWPGSRRCRRR